jgi:putative FmdB family regulatory protein
MPIYEYTCPECENNFEEIQKFNDPHIELCPGCGSLEAKRKVSISAFHLKGGGWYKDGYGDKKKEEPIAKTPDSEKSETSKESSNTESKADSSSDKEKNKTIITKETPPKKLLQPEKKIRSPSNVQR